ncbi:DUF397 domain-containing protein [Streptomyces sp. NBC_01335]|uniref:DUF397 domain-containing protein n=1 Tax=Streptomyces sp. NBC_01335 TaxID=2903828 RepID=UPI002E147991|nr:DUF397 domain-containing protein [Streptomyces sp. NBC_01335]
MTITAHLLAGAEWFKSSYSNDQAQACVEGARLPVGAMAVRDSKVVDGPLFVAAGPAWTAFMAAVIDGRFSG